MLAKGDLIYTRGNLMACGSAILFALTLAFMGITEIESSKEIASAAQKAKVDAQHSLDKVQEEEQQIKQYLNKYLLWDEKLAFTVFKRDWVADQTDGAIKAIEDVATRYKIGARTAYLGKELEGYTGYSLFQYPIELIGRAKHEEAMLTLVSTLDEAWNGPTSWDQCEFKRDNTQSKKGLPYLDFKCTVYWNVLARSADIVTSNHLGVSP